MPVADDTLSIASSPTHVNGHKTLKDGLAHPGQEQPTVSDEKVEDKDMWEHNPHNPRNWSPLKKWIATSLVSFYTLVTPLASSMMAPGLPDLALKYGITNPTVLALTLSIFLLSFAIGPLFLGPLSEMYGRVWVLHISNLVFLCFNLGCALAPTVNSFIGFRFLSGLAGSAPIACGGGVVSDLFSERERASAMAMYTLGPLIGPAIGPVMGGFISQTHGVQSVFYVIVGLCGIAAILAIPLLRETYAPVIRRRLHAQGADLEKEIDYVPVQVGWDHLWLNLKRPVILLTRSFICFILSLYMALIYGIFYLMFATFPDLFATVYHFSVGISGLAYLGLGLGFCGAALLSAKISDQIYHRLAARNGGQGKPEMRIPALIFGSFFAPIGLFWYGWSAQARIHWIMPIIGTTIYGFSLLTTFLPIQLYLVDTFAYSASALAAASVFRSFLGFVFPLFGAQTYAKLGYGGGNSLLAGLAIVFGIPFPVWIYYYGERIRARSSLSR
ncbi:major facilitator superfamily domain-containing protein [Boletus edulis BED1]|uniref:Major facilitator superfamily domain-containing protein n=1 Tax=Boletus edulis BED1 TaxID=1328754 RepID=A0AAD4GKY2_BOLED|nr:major facilitator superfamily domain-containing protein [Boletus edulis BED1]